MGRLSVDMRRAIRQITVFAVALLLLCLLCRLVFYRNYTLYIPMNRSLAASAENNDLQYEIEQPGVLRQQSTEIRPDYLRIKLEPQQAGDTFLNIQDQNGETLAMQHLRVTPLRTVYDVNSGGFTGDSVVLIAITLFWLAVSAIMLWSYQRTRGADFYNYATIYFAGFSMFALVTGLVMLTVTVRHLLSPAAYSMLQAYSAINGASAQFMILTTPLIVVFAVAMAVSNIALLRHEKPRLQNFLGLLVAALMIVGAAIGWSIFFRDLSGSEMQIRVYNTLENTYATVFVYFECMLAGSVICGIRAARHEPDTDQDFIVILGCWFRRDGSLPPLLRGRVDRAVSFWRKQKETTGKEAIIIPSGGQGANETMPEAEAMRRYLLTQGIPGDLIRPEDQSRNTYQNMAYSKAIIDSTAPGSRTTFATTNYHVFRSGIWASLAGLKAEGIGSPTKWWFWPNAFMRECAGLLRNRWKQELVLLILLILFFGALSMLISV